MCAKNAWKRRACTSAMVWGQPKRAHRAAFRNTAHSIAHSRPNTASLRGSFPLPAVHKQGDSAAVRNAFPSRLLSLCSQRGCRRILHIPRSSFSENHGLFCAWGPAQHPAEGISDRPLETFGRQFSVFAWNVGILSLTAPFYRVSSSSSAGRISFFSGPPDAPRETSCAFP